MGPSHAAWVRATMLSYEAKLLRYAADIVGSSLARDVVQDTFLKLCRADRASVDSHLSAWLFTVCRNGCIEIRRKVRRLAELDPHAPDGCAPHSERLEQAESMQRIRTGLLALSEKQREVVRLKFDAELSYKEIAEVTGLTVGHVGFILHTALTRLREGMEAQDRREAVAVRRAR